MTRHLYHLECSSEIHYKNIFHFLSGTVAEWSRALVRNHTEWTVPSSNRGKGCYGDGKLSESHI